MAETRFEVRDRTVRLRERGTRTDGSRPSSDPASVRDTSYRAVLPLLAAHRVLHPRQRDQEEWREEMPEEKVYPRQSQVKGAQPKSSP